MVLAAATPAQWEVTIVDENLGVPDYAACPGPTWSASRRSLPNRRALMNSQPSFADSA